jgi:nicotinate phosphoribosyltransferase
MEKLRLYPTEAAYLRVHCPFLPALYVDYLQGFQFNPDEVTITYQDSDLQVLVEGPWFATILWEVPLLAMISELYYQDMNYSELRSPALKKTAYKGNELLCAGVKFADFGTRRRFSAQHHAKVADELKMKALGNFVGTSNVSLARDLQIRPIGTQAHEWFMFHGAMFGYKLANKLAMENWVDVYGGDLGIALTDTYTTENFFSNFSMKYAKLFDGVRHDSGDPFNFADAVIHHYENLCIDPRSKTIVFSDGLDHEQAIKIAEYCQGQIKCSFGIGTNLTNDLPNVIPRNMVIKMTACSNNGSGWMNAVKLSDEPGKETGDPKEIRLCKEMLQLT